MVAVVVSVTTAVAAAALAPGAAHSDDVPLLPNRAVDLGTAFVLVLRWCVDEASLRPMVSERPTRAPAFLRARLIQAELGALSAAVGMRLACRGGGGEAQARNFL